MWSRRRNGSTMSRRADGNVRRTTNPPPSTVRVAGTTLATVRCVIPRFNAGWPRAIPSVCRAGKRLRGLRRDRLDRTRQRVLPRPVPEEVPVPVVHHVVEPPEEVHAAGEDGGDDPAGVVLLPLLPGRVRRGHVLAQPREDRAELRLDRALGLVVLDEVAVEEHEADEVCDRSEDREQQPDTGGAELGGQPAQDGEVRGDALEVRSELLGNALLAGALPRDLRRRLEQIEAATVVVAHAPHELVEDV